MRGAWPIDPVMTTMFKLGRRTRSCLFPQKVLVNLHFLEVDVHYLRHLLLFPDTPPVTAKWQTRWYSTKRDNYASFKSKG